MPGKETETGSDEFDVKAEMLLDSLRLRAALLLACMELTDGQDIVGAWQLAEEFYESAPALLQELNEKGIKNLPGAGCEILQFPKRPAETN